MHYLIIIKIKLFLLGCFFLIGCNLFAQQATLYNPAANAENDIAAIVKQAKTENKFVLLQAGGNWCSWCIEFARFCKADARIDSIIKHNFIWYHLNYSKENKNKAVFAKYGYPQRFGFPVLIILNGKGERIHTQSSDYLEDGIKSYDQKKVQTFFELWSPKALMPENYKN